MQLFKKTINGVIWSLTNSIGVHLLNFFLHIVLARILDPSAFGILALLQVFYSIGLYLTDSGMNSSIIRLKEPEPEDYSTVFSANLLFSVILYIVVFFGAPLFEEFYDVDGFATLVRVYCLSFIIRSLATTQATFLVKSMNFKRLTVIEMPSLILGGLCGVAMALNGFGVWSLIGLNLTQSVVYAILYWYSSDWRPSISFNITRFKFHFGFGFKISLTNVFNAVFDNLYNVIIGKMFSITALSYYNRAESFQLLPGRILSAALEKVTYPMFSEIQEDVEAMKRTYRTILLILLYWLAPFLILASIISEPLFVFLLTEKWRNMVPLFQILLLAGIFNPMQRFNLNILRIKNKPGLILKLNIAKRVLLVLAVLASFSFGLKAMVWAQSVSFVFSFLMIEYYVGREIDYSIGDFFRDSLSTFALLLVWSGFTGLFFSYFSLEGAKFYLIILFAILAMVIYIVVSYFFGNRAFIESRGILLKFLNR